MSGHVNDSHLVALPRGKCPVCGNPGDRKVVGNVQRQPSVELLQCPHCSAVSVDQVPDNDYLRQLYEPSHYSSALIANDRLRRRLASNVLEHFNPVGRPCISILDYGGNDGSLSRTLIKELRISGYSGSIRALVVDLHVRPEVGEIRFQDVSTFLASSERYDLVLASAVLEHVPHLCPILQRLFKAIDSGGAFYARTPFDVPIGRLWSSRGMKWPRHFHDLGPDFWKSACKMFSVEATMVVSRTSIVESSWSVAPLQTFMATLLKFPSVLETSLLMPWLNYGSPKWRLVGGWEVVFKAPAGPASAASAGMTTER